MVVFGLCGVKKRRNTTSEVPPDKPGPLAFAQFRGFSINFGQLLVYPMSTLPCCYILSSGLGDFRRVSPNNTKCQ